MKTKKIVVVALLLVAYCVLFYQQNFGLNTFIFNLLIVLGHLVLDHTLLRSRVWVAVASAALISSFSVLLHGSTLALTGNFVALVSLGGISFYRHSSLFFAFVQGLLNFPLSPWVKLVRFLNAIGSTNEEKKQTRFTWFTTGNMLMVLIPMVVLTAFFLLYESSNPLFSEFVSNMAAFISIDFMWFAFFGLVLIYLYLFPNWRRRWILGDRKLSNRLRGFKDKESSIFPHLETEHKAAILTFVLLNALLLLVNTIDIKYILFSNEKINNYSAYIHQGINSSIFSVLIAILVTLYFFRGNLNFLKNNKAFKVLALLWILQNVILLATCLHKNYLYIDARGLTQKRIGVYFYLFVTFVGLMLTVLKMMKLKSNMFLVRSNTWSLFIILTCATLVNWNRVILEHNVTHQYQLEPEYYLGNLPETSLPYLYNLWSKIKFDPKKNWDDLDLIRELFRRRAAFIQRYEAQSWQSWTFEDARIYRELKGVKDE